LSRSKNLTDQDVLRIVELLDGWSGLLTWDSLIDAIERRVFARYTRQALYKHQRIRAAFTLRKQALARASDRPKPRIGSPELQAAVERIERLSAENKRLEAENSRLLEQFVRWAYNASTRNLDHAFLSRPLPGVDRDQTRPSHRLAKVTRPRS
jgi:hypothetical protein